jgi:asparagine synthase (glutamine-hydrolysing)
MCGITGIYAFTEDAKQYLHRIETATRTLNNRGPDAVGIYTDHKMALGHTRLSVIDLSTAANQPLKDTTGRYTIVMNGEIYNYKRLGKDLQKQGIVLKTNSDSEVLLHLYIRYGPQCLEKLNGCFAFAVYDRQKDRLFMARDRFGIKPLLYYRDPQKLLFASSMKALMALGIPKKIDPVSLHHYFQLTYIPSPHTIFENVQNLPPGHYLQVEDNQFKMGPYYTLPHHDQDLKSDDNQGARDRLRSLISKSVKLRMTADVPVGVLLSGGIDSSVIVSQAIRYRSNLKTFSMGFADEPHFDETDHAELAARHFHTTHHSFRLTNQELYENLDTMLNDMDEPLGDSSALPMHILSRLTRRHVKVALSGDGADELFAGYNKHRAHYHAIHNGFLSALVNRGAPMWRRLPKSRHTRLTNLFRQLNRFAQGCRRSPKERYWYWASMLEEKQTHNLLRDPIPLDRAEHRKMQILKNIGMPETLNDILYSDMQLVLMGDMLPKVDAMSMANGLEVRTPFLDHTLVNFVMGLDETFKITPKGGKRILKESYRKTLPPVLYRRPKQGFEVPLLPWFKTALRNEIENNYLHPDFIEQQGIFNPQKVSQLRTRLFSTHPGDVQAPIWAMIVFQHWWKKYMT